MSLSNIIPDWLYLENKTNITPFTITITCKSVSQFYKLQSIVYDINKESIIDGSNPIKYWDIKLNGQKVLLINVDTFIKLERIITKINFRNLVFTVTPL